MLSRIDSLNAGNPIDGRGDSWLNLIHVDDAVTAVIACSESELPGQAFNVVDDLPLLRAEYYGLLASIVGAPAPTFDPGRASPRGSGGVNKRCSNKRVRQDLNWRPLFPSVTTGLPASIVSTNQ
jgi:nucleoside-diphosphate-sugar epimerase